MAAQTNRLAGTAYLAIDGVTYSLVGDFEWDPGAVTRESLLGMDGVHGFKEKPKGGKISGTIRDGGGLSVTSFNNMVNVTITCELANGKLIVGRNMWSVESQSVKSEDGTFELKFEGPQGCVTEQ